jgi:hypothetical protein
VAYAWSPESGVLLKIDDGPTAFATQDGTAESVAWDATTLLIQYRRLNQRLLRRDDVTVELPFGSTPARSVLAAASGKFAYMYGLEVPRIPALPALSATRAMVRLFPAPRRRSVR